jgi:hypothetical protein
VRPSFWSDALVAGMPDPVRLFYIGLWCVADDAGWFRWRLQEIGAQLYPYRTVSRREREMTAWADWLIKAHRLVLYPCGCAEVPTLLRHQYPGGKKTFVNKQRHETNCSRSSTGRPALVREVPSVVDGDGDYEKGLGRGSGGNQTSVDALRENVTQIRRRA